MSSWVVFTSSHHKESANCPTRNPYNSKASANRDDLPSCGGRRNRPCFPSCARLTLLSRKRKLPSKGLSATPGNFIEGCAGAEISSELRLFIAVLFANAHKPRQLLLRWAREEGRASFLTKSSVMPATFSLSSLSYFIPVCYDC